MTSDQRGPSSPAEIIAAAWVRHSMEARTEPNDHDLANAEAALAALTDAGYVVVPREDFLEVLSGIDHNASFDEIDAAERLREFMAATKGSDHA